MINLYDSMLNEWGSQVNGRTKLFIIGTESDGSLGNYLHGTACVPESTGTMFIVDEWLIDQLDKVQFKDGALSVKEGVELELPVKTEKELKIEELQRQMAELQAMPDEPANTEEQTDAPLLDYTNEPTE